MTDLQVIFDPVKEIGAIVDMDSGRAFGPAMIGPAADDILQAFIDATPFDISHLDSYAAIAAFGSFLERSTPPDTVAPDATGDGQMVDMATTDMGADNALAEHEAANATDVPPPAPADTDSEASPATVTQEVRCFNCEGAGMIEFGDGAPAQRCGMCGGTGKITQEVPA